MKSNMKNKFNIWILVCVLGCAIIGSANQVNAATDSVSLVGKSAIVMDMDTETILYEKNMDTKNYPASITKVMTALLTIENCNDSDKVTFSSEAVNGIEAGSSAALVNIGETITVQQALHGLLMISANDIANGLAEQVAGSQSAFAKKMTARAKELGATNTNFVNAHGLNNEQHYTTCHDMALIAKAAYTKPEFREIIKTTYYQLPKTNKSKVARDWYNSNRMIQKNTAYYDSRCLGGKTGYTIAAGGTYVTFANINGRTVICVIMSSKNSASAYVDTKTLYDYTEKTMDTASLEAKQTIGSTESATTEESTQKAEQVESSKHVTAQKSFLERHNITAPKIIVAVIIIFVICQLLHSMHVKKIKRKKAAAARKRRKKNKR